MTRAFNYSPTRAHRTPSPGNCSLTKGHAVFCFVSIWCHEQDFKVQCYVMRAGNMAAIMEVDEGMRKNFLQFEPAPRRGEPEVRCSPGAWRGLGHWFRAWYLKPLIPR